MTRYESLWIVLVDVTATNVACLHADENGWGGYPKAVVPSPTMRGYVWSLLTIVPTLYLVSSLMEERVDVGVVNLQMVGPSMRYNSNCYYV